jgi:LuxR family maltose regulon positive regulatory protein
MLLQRLRSGPGGSSALPHEEQSVRLRAYVHGLLAVFSGSAPASAIPSKIINGQFGIFVEPLSKRELEVLQFLSKGLSNQEIGRKLFISAGTVKVHLKHIYDKLNVASRTQAAARARELNLL